MHDEWIEQQRVDDERVVLTVSERIQIDISAVLGRYTLAAAGGISPRTVDYCILHALMEVLGRLLVEAQEVDAERARAWTAKTVERLSLFVAPPAQEGRPS